jgi:hypothetical protein
MNNEFRPKSDSYSAYLNSISNAHSSNADHRCTCADSPRKPLFEETHKLSPIEFLGVEQLFEDIKKETLEAVPPPRKHSLAAYGECQSLVDIAASVFPAELWLIERAIHALASAHPDFCLIDFGAALPVTQTSLNCLLSNKPEISKSLKLPSCGVKLHDYWPTAIVINKKAKSCTLIDFKLQRNEMAKRQVHSDIACVGMILSEWLKDNHQILDVDKVSAVVVDDRPQRDFVDTDTATIGDLDDVVLIKGAAKLMKPCKRWCG